MNEQSYLRYRVLMQLIDCALLDITTLQYKPRALLASLLYLLIGKSFKQFTTEQIVEIFPHSSMYLLDAEDCYNDLFSHFLIYSFGFQLIDLLPNVQYISTFFQLPVDCNLPTATRINQENVLEVDHHHLFSLSSILRAILRSSWRIKHIIHLASNT